MTDDTSPPKGGSDLRGAVFGSAGDNDSAEGSGAGDAPEPVDSESSPSGAPPSSSARFGAAQSGGSTFVGVTPEYHGMAGPLAKIVIVNMLLNVITLGIYRFWGKTRLRDYIWSHLHFQDENFEYSGTGKELFFGFLIALLVLAPVVIGFSVLGLVIPDPAMQVLFAFLQVVLFVFLFQFAIYRARRYRMSRTQWRGIRAGQVGTATRYAFKAMGYMLLTGLTLGLAYPWMHTALERYKVENTQFGDRPFTFEGGGKALFPTWFLCWVLMAPTWGLAFLWYRAAAFRYFTDCTRYEGLRFESDITGGQILKIYFILGLYAIGLLMVVSALTVLPVTLLGASTDDFEAFMQDPMANPGFYLAIVGVAGVGLLAAMAAYGVLIILFLTQRMIALHSHSLTITGDIDFDAIRQSALAAPTRGEGFADALDVGGI